MSQFSGYLLVIHGSSDPRPWEAATVLAEFFAQRIRYTSAGKTIVPGMSYPTDSGASFMNGKSALSQPEKLSQLDKLFQQSQLSQPSKVSDATSSLVKPLVGVAMLEKATFPLHQQIEQFSKLLQPDKATAIQPARLLILPLFLLKGVHVMEDIPAEIALAQQRLGQNVAIELTSYLGCHPGLYRLVTERMAALPVEAWVLMAHGSRRAGANEAIEQLAERLGAVTAYWSTAPDLENRLHELKDLGLRRIAVFPYFLFSGGITDAIAQTVDRFSQQFPGLDIHLATPLNASPEIADLLVELAEGRVTE